VDASTPGATDLRTLAGSGAGGQAGTAGGNGSGGRVKIASVKANGSFTSTTPDGPAPTLAPAGPIAGTGYKEAL
jgi:hypothetical protein